MKARTMLSLDDGPIGRVALARAGSLLGAAVVLASVASAQSADPAAGIRGAAGSSTPPPPTTGTNTNAVDFTPGSGSCGSNNNQCIGWQFDVTTEVTVVAMSWFDDGGNGLDLAHEVGIWDPSGTLIATTHTTIPAGTAAVLDGIWRVVPITPTDLPPGSGYIVGGFNGVHGECLSFNVSQTVVPELTYIDATFSGINNIFERPSNFSGATNGFYGVGFQVGDGGGIGTKYCTANSNSTGNPADLTASGSASSSAGDLTLTSAPVPNQPGIFFHGANQSQIPFGNGFLCASGDIVRGAVVIAAGNSASYTYDNSDNKHSVAAYIGVTRNFQHWYRDPAGGGAFFNTSNAMAITILP